MTLKQYTSECHSALHEAKRLILRGNSERTVNEEFSSYFQLQSRNSVKESTEMISNFIYGRYFVIRLCL